ncbi:DUF5980 family protein [Micromonospora sp. NPDC048947]|uniref:DUF5980 family protein n=1 Tax=Micromonospora sp. NPDC048947 TaxID=3154826 RepID=UPI0033D86CBC
MKFTHTASRIAVAAVATTLLALSGGTPGSAAPGTTTTHTPSTWTLVDLPQRLCATPDDPRALYYFVVLDGAWSAPVTADYTGMPVGVEVYSPLTALPGSGDGHVVQILAAFRLSGVAPGRYVPQLRVTDGAVTQSAPVVLDVRSSC